MTTPGPPPDLTQPFAQGQQGGGWGADDGSTGTGGGSVIDDVTAAAGEAVAGATGLSGGILSGLTGLFESIASGMAHTVNVILNNMFYGGIVTLGAILMVAGFWMLINATPAGAAISSTAGKAAGLATKAIPFV